MIQRLLHRQAVPVAALVLAGAQLACGGGHEAGQLEAAPPLEVRVARATMAEMADVFEAGGVVQARTTAVLVSRLMAPVREVRVQPGDRVRAGQTLVLLDDRDLTAHARRARAGAAAAEQGQAATRSQRDAAQAQLTLARATHARVAGLHAKKSATDQELDQATAALRAAEAQLAAATSRETEAGSGLEGARAGSEVAEATASFAVITAPFDGVVTEKLVEEGNMAAPGTPLVRVEDSRGFRLEVRVDASRAGSVRPGDAVPVTIETGAGDAVVSGRVAEVARAVEADARAFLVKIALPDGVDVRSGTFGRVRLPGARRTALTVPTEAVVRRGQVASVFVVDQQRARLRLVNVGPEAAGGVEVLAGLVDGETVVVAPPAQLADGRAVRVGGRP